MGQLFGKKFKDWDEIPDFNSIDEIYFFVSKKLGFSYNHVKFIIEEYESSIKFFMRYLHISKCKIIVGKIFNIVPMWAYIHNLTFISYDSMSEYIQNYIIYLNKFKKWQK